MIKRIQLSKLQVFFVFSWLGILLISAMLSDSSLQAGRVLAQDKPQDGPYKAYLAMLSTSSPAIFRTINAPYFNVSDVFVEKFSEMAIAWFGRLTTQTNYTDIRVGYNNTTLTIHLATFDRLLFNQENPTVDQLTRYDSISLYLSLDTFAQGVPTTNTYRFDVQAGENPRPADYYAARQVAYRGNNSNYVISGINFTNRSGNSWEDGDTGGYNNLENNRGYYITYYIPFSSLGLSSSPAQGTVWRMAVVNHDREDLAGTTLIDQTWPESINTNVPATWGKLHFGLASAYNPPSATVGGTTVLRHGLNGQVVTDVAVGGTIDYLCPGDPYVIWNEWPYENFAGAEAVNVGNQGNLADWPCFSKMYVTFPTGAIPAGKVILSATYKMYTWGGLEPSEAAPSLIQVLTVSEDWSETTINWNNAPLALENIAQTWVNVIPGGFAGWPGVGYTWDVSRALAQAYASGLPLRLAVYEADLNLHSGKFFSTSEAFEGWTPATLVEARPSITVVWGNP